MLTEFTEKLTTHLIPKPDWHPFPNAAERTAWEALPEALRAEHIAQGESLLGHKWPSLSATRFLEYARIGNRSNYQAIRYARRHALRHLDFAISGIGRMVGALLFIWALKPFAKQSASTSPATQ